MREWCQILKQKAGFDEAKLWIAQALINLFSELMLIILFIIVRNENLKICNLIHKVDT